MMSGRLPAGWEKSVPVFAATEEMATRDAGGKVMNAVAKTFEGWLVGGSADLAPSTKTILKDFGHIGPGNFGGMNMHFGVREHAMGAILNGLALHGGFIPFGATFMVFADYMRPTLRIAAISKLPVIYVFTHDSIGVGEDGPTHQPVEHLASFRVIPGLTVIRPADANETAAAWKVALERRNGPTVLALTRQKLPTLDAAKYPVAAGVPRGAYILSEAAGLPGGSQGAPELLLIASGSEVTLALQAQSKLAAEGIRARVVSMPSWELFEAQDAAYKARVLHAGPARLVIEAGVRHGWDRYLGAKGDGIWQNSFGVSGTYKDVFKRFGFTAENVVAKAKALLGK
jgi:transketolase